MANNVLITSRCNRKCAFCFAQSRLGDKSGDQAVNISQANIRKIMSFLERTGERNLRLLGGEPTLHPDFTDIVEEAFSRDFTVHVFTNGIMSSRIADFLGELPSDRFSVLCNISPQAEDSDRQKKMRDYALDRLGKRAQLGISLTSPEFEFDFLLDSIKKFNLRPKIRIGVAQPLIGADNQFLETSAYRETGQAIAEMARACIAEDVLIGFDCGLTPCMFSEEELGLLMTSSEGFACLCRPIIDIGPELDIWHCFPLSEVFNTNLERFRTRSDIVRFYEKIVAPFRSLGCMPECLRCDYLRRGQCTGGCLAHTMNSLNRKPPRYVPDNQESFSTMQDGDPAVASH